MTCGPVLLIESFRHACCGEAMITNACESLLQIDNTLAASFTVLSFSILEFFQNIIDVVNSHLQALQSFSFSCCKLFLGWLSCCTAVTGLLRQVCTRHSQNEGSNSILLAILLPNQWSCQSDQLRRTV